MNDASLQTGLHVSFSKTVSESDVQLFAGITDELSLNDINEAFMRGTHYGHRIAHGAPIVGYMSRDSTMITERVPEDGPVFPVSLGCDRIGLLAPVFIGDTVAIAYEATNYDLEKQRSIGKVVVTNEPTETVARAEPIMRWLPKGARG